MLGLEKSVNRFLSERPKSLRCIVEQPLRLPLLQGLQAACQPYNHSPRHDGNQHDRKDSGDAATGLLLVGEETRIILR